jgi:ABC-2 type transport system ATP-binding protein
VSAVNVKGLCKSYGAVRAVDDVSFSVERGEVFALLGPNGAGKTTVLEILEGFRARGAGEVEVLGVDPGERRTQRWLRERLGIVLQELAVEPLLTVRQLLTRNAGYYPSPRPVSEVIELIGLADKADARMRTLSGGQQRRLDLGLGIVGNPELLFLDEPTTGLDPEGRRRVWDVVRQLSAAGTTVILTTHYMDEAEALASRITVMSAGRIAASGTPASIGGRDLDGARILFQLPEGISCGELPVPSTLTDGGVVEIRTSQELPVLHALTGWAMERDLALAGLTVSRSSLEDIYLQLTSSDLGEVQTTGARK